MGRFPAYRASIPCGASTSDISSITTRSRAIPTTRRRTCFAFGSRTTPGSPTGPTSPTRRTPSRSGTSSTGWSTGPTAPAYISSRCSATMRVTSITASSIGSRRTTHTRSKLVGAIMDRYNLNARIAMWDLWNEPDIGHDAYWASVGGIDGFKAWAGGYIADVKPHSSNHLVTMGIGGSTTFPGVTPLRRPYQFFYNDIPGLDVSNHHTYSTAEDQYLVDFETDWHQALCKPHYESEFGYNLWDPGNNSLGYGYWPWYANHTRTAGWSAISTMVFLNNSKGPYADYPYLGPLPPYPFTFKPYGLEEPMG